MGLKRKDPSTCVGIDKTYANRTGEIQLSCRTTYRDHEHGAIETGNQSEHGAEGICSYSSCPHEGDRGQSQGQDTGMHITSLSRSSDNYPISGTMAAFRVPSRYPITIRPSPVPRSAPRVLRLHRVVTTQEPYGQ